MSDNIKIGLDVLDSNSPKLNILEESEPIKISDDSRSVNFGPGIEMLMNHKNRSGSAARASSDKDLDNLEADLDNLTMNLDLDSKPKPLSSDIKKSAFSTEFNFNEKKNDDALSIASLGNDIGINIEKPSIAPIAEKVTNSERPENNETWDGFKKFNDIPVNPNVEVPKVQPLSREEQLKKKFELLRKFDALKKKGVRLTKDYNMESSLDEMQGEYEMIVSEKEKSNSVKFQGKMMMALVTGLEYLNNRFDPFDLKLDGWAESVTENIDDYDEIFSELHEKYRSKATMAPELKLLFQLGGSAIMLHMTNTMFKSAMPGMDDIMKQNPELMQQFTQAAVGSMSQNNPGFGNFMSGIMSDNTRGGNSNYNEPEPVRREEPQYMSMPPRGSPPGPRQPNYDDNGRPDLGGMGASSSRPEMKGPSDISDILSGLKQKSKTIQISAPKKMPEFRGGGSTISIDELQSISKDADNIPRKSKRKPRSERNTVSLDI